MNFPADAGALVVDLRSRSRSQIWIAAAIIVVLGLLPAGDPTLWPVSAFFGGIAVVTVTLLAIVRMGSRRVVAVCEHGLVVRYGLATTLVPWPGVRRMHLRWRALRGSRLRQIIVDTNGASVTFGFVPGQGRSRADDDVTDRAIAEIQARANVKLERAPGKPKTRTTA